MRLLAVFGLALVFTGCATSSGVVPMGQDTYFIQRTDSPVGIGSVGTVQPDAIREASAFCEKSGKQIKVINTTVRPTKFAGKASADVQFTCVSSSDPVAQAGK